jgi:hypothetical protein
MAPMAAEHQIVAAVFNPRTLPASLKITPAPETQFEFAIRRNKSLYTKLRTHATAWDNPRFGAEPTSLSAAGDAEMKFRGRLWRESTAYQKKGIRSAHWAGRKIPNFCIL